MYTFFIVFPFCGLLLYYIILVINLEIFILRVR